MTFNEMLKQPLPSKQKPIACFEVTFCDDGSIFIMEDTSIETKVDKVGTVKFAVYHEDTAVPHFHVFNKETDKHKRIDTCFKFDVGEYFLHGKHDTTLNNQQLKKLQETLESHIPNEDDPEAELTLWENLRDIWDSSASAAHKIQAEKIPDYRDANKLL